MTICLPPSVVISQKALKGFPHFSGSIQYSPSPLESPESRMSLQECAGWLANKHLIPTKNRTCIKFKSNNISIYHSVMSLWDRKKSVLRRGYTWICTKFEVILKGNCWIKMCWKHYQTVDHPKRGPQVVRWTVLRLFGICLLILHFKFQIPNPSNLQHVIFSSI